MNEEKLRVDKFIETHRRESMTTFENFDAERQSLNLQVESLLQKHNTKHTAITQQLYEKAVSLYKFLQSFDAFLARLVLACPEVFENVATQQMKCVEVKLAVKNMLSSACQTEIQPGARNVFAKIREHESLLSTCVDLPLLFGVVLIEKRRQFEWHDFYSKGIIANVSEQLAVIIEDEKIYQKLWIKEFGSLIKLFNLNTDMHVRVPAIDVTLVNSGLFLSENSVLHWLGDSRVERADVLNYIESVRHHRFVNNDRFAALLEKNFRGLVMCTEKLKAVTKAVVSLRSHAMLRSDVSLQLQLRVQENGLGVEEDEDLKLIKGLKSRVKKLEDLLHQQQFKNLTGWPVVKSNDGQPSETKASLLLSKPRTDLAVHNPINLLPKTVPLRKPSQELVSELSNRKYMDASTTIDKHLDNIRLRRENSELRAAASELASQNGSLKSDLEACRQTCEDLKLEHEEVRLGLEEQVALTRAAADEEKSRHKEETASLQKAHDTAVEELKTRLASLEKTLELKHSQNSSLESEIADNEALRDEISTLTAKLSDLLVMNAELLSNMQAKESEVSTERSETEKRTKDLEYKLEEKTEDFEHLMEMTQGKLRSMEELLTATNRCIRSLLGGVGGLLASHVKYFHDLCVILESMGLLLVREVNGETKLPEFRIRRVKGLRSKKDTDGSRPHLERTQSTAVQEITKGFEWITGFAEQQMQTIEPGAGAEDVLASAEEITHDPDALEAETQQLLQLCETYVMSKGGAASKVSEFLGTVAFEENVQLQAHEDGREFSTDRFFPNGIIKRFNDVEGFAKRLTKETKAKSSELAKATKQANGKVSVKNFQAGDLVLFLPTRIEHAHDNREAEPAVTPWAAFNIDAPHYFLELGDRADSISSEEWIVSRIASITDHVVTEANARDAAANPFALSVGITWHMIQTE
ncbi:hypothetical protein METBIDRAFT_37604 [Metschnikowia bicuspidata var. bicuspidata NRRL YB-4993]|uniref:Autophagy-related protein 11 n=1 Tax=Metschnikowia bicuspidata var. bicuspidata NRRL YB-4993 TaxID=869754 RepID=A0A1A0HGH5_9ASCO|nr:hypothetical protein METBIDRAFT_37604 [Metschnikowia bicuspidata var. bicuspidata NRRL YB-4993]OBA23106.1 hypothetical protein METBIDRAFT_37604 [Metschnikowia bicuspidata var. bicuspidata NRRL YB-4993]